MTNALLANDPHADFAQAAEVRRIAHGLDPADVLAMAAGERGEFFEFSPRTNECAEAGKGFAHRALLAELCAN